MTPRQLAVEVENAFDGRDRESMVRYLGQLVATAQPPDFSRLTREHLEQRRGDLMAQLADINDRLIAMQHAGRRTAAPPTDWVRGSIDPSDPS